MELKGKQCRCNHCGELFSRVRAFDRHRVGSFVDRGIHRRCLAPMEMLARGWTKDEHGFWVLDNMAKRLAQAAGSPIRRRRMH